jgi:hypothetical protein
MKLAEALLIVALGIGSNACARKPKVANVPPAPPKPAVAPAPAPPPEPLSIPQTNVHLPPPQPLTPEAIATTHLPGEPPQAPAPQTRPAAKTRPTAPRPAVEQPPTPVPAPVAPPATDRPTVITEVLPAAELKRLQEDAATRMLEARKLLANISRTRRRQQLNAVTRVETFLKQAEEARDRGDMLQASELAGRALVLARELKP